MGYAVSFSQSQTSNPAANQSTVFVSATLYRNSGRSFWGQSTTARFDIGGVTHFIYAPSSLGLNSSYSYSWSRTFTHSETGFRGSIYTNFYVDVAGIYYSGLIGGTTFGSLDYDRKPAAPSTVTPTLNANKSITVESNAVSSPAGTPTYYVGWSSSADLGATWGDWSAYTTIPSNGRSYTYNFGTLQPGLTYRFRMYASNTDGSSAATISTLTVFLPAGAKRFDGTEWKQGTIANIFTATGWKPITTAKRFDGTNWVNLT